MTVTPTQVQDILTTIKEELEAGTWTNYVDTPKIHTKEQKKSSKNAWIELLNDSGEIVYAFNNSPIYFENTCDLVIKTPNRTDLNNIYADVINIFAASSKNIIIKNPRDRPLRGKYKKIMKVQLLDI